MLFNKLLTPMLGLVFALHSPVFAQEAPSPQQALQNFSIGPTQIEQLERGEIVSYEVSETSKKELGIGLAMIIPVALPKIVNYIRQGNLTMTESDLIDTGPLFTNADLNSFQKFGFTNQQIDEAKSFLAAEPGDAFNLSKLELDSLKSLSSNIEDADNETLLKTANQKYREFLLQRITAYKKSGLAGIAAYSREGGIADPAAELLTDAINSKAWAHISLSYNKLG